MTDKQYLTQEGAEKLKKELETLKGEKRRELAARLRSAIQMGDLSENADYIAAKEEQAFLEGKIQEIEYLLRHAEIIDTQNNNGFIDLGSTVTIQEGSYPPEVYYIVGRKEADPKNGRISNESPIGKALIGKKAGDTVSVNTPDGNIELKILKVE